MSDDVSKDRIADGTAVGDVYLLKSDYVDEKQGKGAFVGLGAITI